MDREPLPCPEKPAGDLAPLTKVLVLSSKPVLWLLQQRPVRLLALALGALLGGWCAPCAAP